MNILRDELYKCDVELIANRVGVHKQTIYAIRSGRTMWPRHATMLALIHVLGYELWLMK
jgi:DNA-binding XRE family transcriptional regulator